ncbi:MAG: hypothetical protein ACO3X1_16405, partial [Burkholderiaceae bacterium]
MHGASGPASSFISPTTSLIIIQIAILFNEVSGCGESAKVPPMASFEEFAAHYQLGDVRPVINALEAKTTTSIGQMVKICNQLDEIALACKSDGEKQKSGLDAL